MILFHLAKRFIGSLSREEPSDADVRWVVEQLKAGELALWESMSVQDRRHSIEVARRFVGLRPSAVDAEVAAALLHDVGKTASGLGTFQRVLATIVGARTTSFRAYHDHERLGADMAAAAGSGPVTVDLIRRSTSTDPEARGALAEADNI